MTYVQQKAIELEGITLHTVPTKKYKTITFVLQMIRPITPQEVTKRALLPYVLQSGTKSHPSSKALRTALDDLYGASLSVDLSKKGENQVISIRMEVANEKYLSDSTPLMVHALQLLSEVVLSPAVENGAFLTSIVEKEKRSLKQQIESIYDDKMRYANKRLVEEMFEGEPYQYNVYGNENEIDNISSQDLYTYYKDVIENDRMDLYVIGDFSEQELSQNVQHYFQAAERKNNSFVQSHVSKEKEIEKAKEVFEEQDVQQGKLHMGYRTSITYADEGYFALQVYNGIFGGFSHSKLFMNVREKESLAYYAVSRFESHKGAIFVMSGIETANYEKTVKIIQEQQNEMLKGNITDDELNQTKTMIKNQILETIDNAYGLAEVLYHTVVAGCDRTIEEWMDGIDRVTKEDIKTAAKNIKLDTIYFLKGGSSNGEKAV